MLKFVRYLLMKMTCKRIDHVWFTINAGFYELIGEDKKYYYFKGKNEFAKVLKEEEGKELCFLNKHYNCKCKF